MPKVGLRKKINRQNAAPESFDAWFDRELAEIKAGLARLEASSLPKSPTSAERQPRPRKRHKRRVSEPTVTTGSPTTSPPAPEPTTPVAGLLPVSPSAPPGVRPAAQPPSAASPPLPTGTDLADPKNFGLMPPIAELEQGTAKDDEYRQRLSQQIAFATKVLHTSRVPAAVWREWRAFEKSAQQRLRTLTGRAVEVLEQY